MSDNSKRGIVFAAILLVILYALGLRIDHPKSGLKNALGTAESSVAVYWHKSDKIRCTRFTSYGFPFLGYISRFCGIVENDFIFHKLVFKV